jgi:hypothetical protein
LKLGVGGIEAVLEGIGGWEGSLIMKLLKSDMFGLFEGATEFLG